MKSELRNAAHDSAIAILTSALPTLIPIRESKKNCFAMDTGVADESGRPVYVSISVSVKNNDGTKTTAPFVLDNAIAELAVYEAQPKKERKIATPKELTPEELAKKEARENLMLVIEKWLVENGNSEGMTTTDIANAIPECAGVRLMDLGSMLKKITERNLHIQRNVINGKPHYTVE